MRPPTLHRVVVTVLAQNCGLLPPGQQIVCGCRPASTIPEAFDVLPALFQPGAADTYFTARPLPNSRSSGYSRFTNGTRKTI